MSKKPATKYALLQLGKDSNSGELCYPDDKYGTNKSWSCQRQFSIVKGNNIIYKGLQKYSELSLRIMRH